jgi:hypothetical protein
MADMTGQQNAEYDQDDYTTGINSQLNGRKKFIIQQKAQKEETRQRAGFSGMSRSIPRIPVWLPKAGKT